MPEEIKEIKKPAAPEEETEAEEETRGDKIKKVAKEEVAAAAEKKASDALLGAQKLPGKWFRKIPVEILLSPGGMILIFFALVMEILDLVPIPFVDYLWEIPKELVFMAFLAIIAKIPWQSMVIPFIIERIPAISDIVPTWLIRMFL